MNTVDDQAVNAPIDKNQYLEQQLSIQRTRRHLAQYPPRGNGNAGPQALGDFLCFIEMLRRAPNRRPLQGIHAIASEASWHAFSMEEPPSGCSEAITKWYKDHVLELEWRLDTKQINVEGYKVESIGLRQEGRRKLFWLLTQLALDPHANLGCREMAALACALMLRIERFSDDFRQYERMRLSAVAGQNWAADPKLRGFLRGVGDKRDVEDIVQDARRLLTNAEGHVSIGADKPSTRKSTGRPKSCNPHPEKIAKYLKDHSGAWKSYQDIKLALPMIKNPSSAMSAARKAYPKQIQRNVDSDNTALHRWSE